MLVKAGVDLGEGATQCLYFEHHERAARAVLVGEADACGVRDIVGEKFLGRGLRMLARSRPIPNFPIVVGPHVSDEIRREIVHALLELPQEDPNIARSMTDWDEELARGFVPSNDAEYDGVRALAEEVFGHESLTLPAERLRCSGPDR
jgi:ABC-type phosphate/phosphonate transport system substrate-binding protein